MRCLRIAVAILCMVSSHTVGYFSFKMLYGCESIVTNKISYIDFEIYDNYQLAVENYTKQIVEVYNQAILNDRD